MPLSWIYGKIIDVRNALYEKDAFKSFSLGAPTISIGNITVGGTGKTPMVAFVAEILIERGEKVCILTRGYGRANPKERILVSDGEKILADARTAGDEPFELARKLQGEVVIIADADRVAAAEFAKKTFGVSAFILDDAFQHRRARRDLDIVLLDATNPFGNERTLPFGRLREPLENLKRADLLIITRANLAAEERIANYELRIRNYNSDCPILTAENKVSNLVALNDFLSNTQKTANDKQITSDHQPLTTDRYFAFCALGNPDNFFEQMRRESFNLTATRKFPDHHRYTQTDAVKLESEAKQNGAKVLLTTAKDAVKLAKLKFEMPCFVVESEMIFKDEKKLRDLIDAVFNPKPKI